MAQSGFTPISLYYSSTGAAVPSAGNLVAGELALNTNDGKLYYKNSSGVVTLLAGATSGPAGGSTTQVQYNNAGVLAGITGATTNGTALTLTAPVLGTPASGTVTNLTGTASININGTVGATTPAAGSFTTLAASGPYVAITPTVGTSAGAFRVNNNGGSTYIGVDNSAGTDFTTGVAYSSVVYTPTNFSVVISNAVKAAVSSTGLAVTGTLSATGVMDLSGVNQIHQLSGHNFVQGDATRTYLYGGTNGIQMRTSNNATALFEMTDAGQFSFSPAGTTTAVVSSTGLAVTGTLSATGTTTVGGTAGGTLNIGASPASDSSAFIKMMPTNIAKSWQIGVNTAVVGDMSFTPSTTNGGSTFTTPVVYINTAGLAVTGTLGVSGQVSNYDSTAGNLCGVASKSYTALGNTSSAVATLTFQTAYNLAIIEVEWVGTNASVTTFTYASVKRYIQTYASAIAVNTAIYTDVVSGGTVVFTASGNTVIVTVTNTCGNAVNAGLTVRVSTGGSNSAGQRDVAIAFT